MFHIDLHEMSRQNVRCVNHVDWSHSIQFSMTVADLPKKTVAILSQKICSQNLEATPRNPCFV